jgi:hypothetical protein
MMLQNGAYDPSAGTFSGYCVECETDCDCGVNQYCGIDKDKVKRIFKRYIHPHIVTFS